MGGGGPGRKVAVLCMEAKQPMGYVGELPSFLAMPCDACLGCSLISVRASKVGWRLHLEQAHLLSPPQSRKSGRGTNMALGKRRT